MKSSASSKLRYGTWLIVLIVAAASASPPRPAGNLETIGTWLSGYDALREARWTDAQKAFSDAISAGHNQESVYLARAVALVLDEKFEAGAKDLLQLREAKLWRYVVDQMSASTRASGSGIPVPRSLQKEYGQTSVASVSIPGHLVQGGTDYPTDYASFVFYQMARPYREAKDAGSLSGNVQVAAARAEAGRWFANRWTAQHADFAYLLFQRALRQFAAGDYAASLAALSFVRFNYPTDPDVNALVAENLRSLGQPVSARDYYTRALTQAPDLAEAYLGRAECAALMGDSRRMKKDLEHATSTRAELDTSRITRICAKAREQSGDPGELYTTLLAAALEGTSLDELTQLAERLHRAANAGRLYYDEWYQERLRELGGALKKAPQSPDPAVALARFLIDESAGRGEAVEPRRGVGAYRFRFSEGEELQQALRYTDIALQAEPKHIEARVVKALALLELGQEPAARRLVDDVMRMTGFDHPEALKLYAEYKFRRAGGQLMQAFGLRMPSFSTSTRREWRSDGLWEIRTTTRTDPSSGDLARAAQVQGQAMANLREAELAMQKAVQLTRGTLQGLLLEADYEHWYRSREKAGKLLAQAVKEHPQSLSARDKLAWWYQWMGAEDQAVEARAQASQLVHTTGEPYLGKIWRRLERNQRNNPLADLERARALDPTDARVPAYAGALHAANGDLKQAQAYFKAALALEQARLRLDHPTNTSQGARFDAANLALAWELRDRLGRLAEQQGDIAEAMSYYTASIQEAERVGPGAPAQPMFGAMLPDPGASMMPRPTPENGANLMARAYVQAGLLQARQGATQRAQHSFEKAASFGRPPGWMVPNIGTGKGDNNFNQFATSPAADAQYELARLKHAAGDVEGARALMQAAFANQPPEHKRREMVEFDGALVRAVNDRLQQEREVDYSRQQAEVERELRQQEQLARQRQEQKRAGAPLDPVLVGTWQLSAEQAPFGGGPKSMQLKLNDDGTYTLEESGTRTSGKAQAWNSRMILTPTTGQAREFFYRHLLGGALVPGRPAKARLQLVTRQSGPIVLEQE